MEWFESLYDDFRQRTGFGSIPEEQTRAEVDFLVRELGLKPGDKVLDLFSGTGRHSIELSGRGIDATAVELNADYLAIARERAGKAGVSPQFIQGDVRTVDFGSSYEAAIILWMSFGYFGDADERAVLRKVQAALKPGGRFVIEVLNRDYILRHFSPRQEQVIDGVKVVEDRQFDALASRTHSSIRRIESGRVVTRETHWRLYSPHELKGMVEGVGLRFIAGYGSLDGEPIGLETRLMRLVFQKDGPCQGVADDEGPKT